MDVVDKFESRYGEAPSNDQNKIKAQGNVWLDLRYPGLDYIKTARIVSDEAVDDTAESTETGDAESSTEDESADNDAAEADERADTPTSDENRSD